MMRLYPEASGSSWRRAPVFSATLPATWSWCMSLILGIGFKTLSNYTNHVADTPLDQAFAKAAWSKAA